MTKKILNKKQKIVISIVAALLIIALGVTAYVMISKKTRTTVALADVTAGDITETLKLSGTVNSENQASFEILDGTYVKSVNVRVGDAVKKGDVLATFDTSSLNSVLAEKQQAYLTAVENYNNAKNTAVSSSAQLKEINARLAEINKELEKQEQEQNKNNNQNKNDQNKTDSDASNKFWELVSKALGMDDINAALKKLDELLNSGNYNIFGTVTV